MTTTQLKEVEVAHDEYIAIVIAAMREFKQLIINSGDFEWPDYPTDYVDYKVRVLFDFRVLCLFRDNVYAHPVSKTPEFIKIKRKQDVAERKYERLAIKYAPIETIRPLSPELLALAPQLLASLIH